MATISDSTTSVDLQSVSDSPAKHLHASGLFTDTETTVTVSLETQAVTLRVRMLPGLRSWSIPPAHVLRAWADKALRDTGFIRSTARRRVTSGHTGWVVTFHAEPA